MLETQVMPHYLQGENVMANLVNQQGRIALARLAGILDCEGCLYLNAHPQNGRPSYAPVLKFTNSDVRILDEICESLDGFGFEYNRTDNLPTGMGGKVSEIRLHGAKRSLPFLRMVLPLLSAKSQVADLFTAFCERRARVTRGAPYEEEDFRLCRAIRSVNSHGTARDVPVGDHVELVGPSRIAKLDDVQAAAKLSAIVECDGSMGLTNLRNGMNYMPSIYICNTNESLLAEIRSSLSRLGLAYYFRAKAPHGISVKVLGEFHVQGMKRVCRFLNKIQPYFRAYAKKASLLSEFIDSRTKVYPRTPYSDHERKIKTLIDEESFNPQRLNAKPAFGRKIESGLTGDCESVAEMTTPCL